MPSIQLVEAERVRALYLLWLDHPSQPTRMEIALRLCEIPDSAKYRDRQVASSRLSGALSGSERVSRSRWSHWLHLATAFGLNAEPLRDGALPDDPRRNVWPLPSRANRTGRTPRASTEKAASKGARSKKAAPPVPEASSGTPSGSSEV